MYWEIKLPARGKRRTRNDTACFLVVCMRFGYGLTFGRQGMMARTTNVWVSR